MHNDDNSGKMSIDQIAAICDISRMTKLAQWRRGSKPRPTQAKIARRLNISRSYLSEIESGAKLPSLDLAFRIERETEGAVPARSWASVEAAA